MPLSIGEKLGAYMAPEQARLQVDKRADIWVRRGAV